MCGSVARTTRCTATTTRTREEMSLVSGPAGTGSGATGKKAIADAALRERVLALRARGKSFRSIADELKISVSTAHGLAKSAFDALPRPNAEQLRMEETARLEYLREEVQGVIDRRHYVV